MSNEWQDISTAPKDGTWFIARGNVKDTVVPYIDRHKQRRTQWGKTSHVPIYGWCWISSRNGGDPEYDLWNPTHWKPQP